MTKSQSWDDTPYSHEDHQRDQHLNKRPKTLSWDQQHAVPQLNSIEHQQNSTDTKGNDSLTDTQGNQSLNKYAQYLTASKSNVGIKVVKIPQQITRLHTTDINNHSLRKSNSVKDEFHGQSRQTNIKTTIIPNTKIPTKPAMERNNNTVLPITEPMKLYASIKPQRSNKTNANIVSNLATVKLYGNNAIKKTSQKPVTIKKESFQRSVSLKKESDSGFIPNHSNPSENVSNTATFTISDTEIPKIGIVSKSKTQKLKRVIEHPLSVEQQHILNKILVEKKSIFFTGKAGTGKSFLLRSIIHKAKSLFKEDEIAVTATTGLAGYNIGGSTLHSFAGIGIANHSISKLIAFVWKNPRTRNAWQSVKLLIVDEISMIDPEYFDKLNKVAKSLKGNQKPFGGIQIVLTGDFMQLPPPCKGETKFVFESDAWKELDLEIFQLTKIFRQNDSKFIQILNQMRTGDLTSESCQLLRELSRPVATRINVKPTKLFSLRKEVDQENKKELLNLDGPSTKFPAIDEVVEERFRKNLDDITLAPKELELRIGAQVLLIKNMRYMGLYNGSVGKIVSFTIDTLTVEFENCSTDTVVTFARECWEVEGPDKKVMATRKQFPFILAYSLSIHKSQGQNLHYVTVDLANVFEKGQAYVAISRCTSMAGLQVLNFNPSKVQAHPKVIEFHKQLNIY